MTRKCKKCAKDVFQGYPDPCLGFLPDVAHACCGHGNIRQAYVCGFDDCRPGEGISSEGDYKPGYWVLRREDAIEYFEEVKNGAIN
jgi:hypothetical protein